MKLHNPRTIALGIRLLPLLDCPVIAAAIHAEDAIPFACRVMLAQSICRSGVSIGIVRHQESGGLFRISFSRPMRCICASGP